MRALVAASEGVFTCDMNGSTRWILRGGGPYYGITWNDEHVFVMARNAHKTIVQTTVEVLDRQLRHKSSRQIPEVVNAHQAHWHNGVLYVANTNRNRVEMFDGDLETLGYVRWTEETYDYNHVNSVWVHGDRLFVCEHNGGAYSKPEWMYQSEVRIFSGAVSPSEQTGKKIIGSGFSSGFKQEQNFPIGKGIHNYLQIGDVGYVCSSQEESLISTDGRSCKFDGWHPRGLGMCKGNFVVGLSPCLPRSQRNFVGDGALAIVDTAFNLNKEIHLPSKKQINEVRLLDVEDWAHNGNVLSP